MWSQEEALEKAVVQNWKLSQASRTLLKDEARTPAMTAKRTFIVFERYS